MPSGQQPEKRMHISCKRCQDRKVKCSRTYPCHRCVGARVHCEVRGDGLKRPPISREYVAGLENKIAALEVFLLDLKSASGSDKEKMIASIEFSDHLAPAVTSPGSDFDPDIWDTVKRGVWRRDAEGTSCYYGPSSIYKSELLSFPNAASSVTQTTPLSPVYPVHVTLHDPILRECLANFFHWHQPHSSFVDWDALLTQYNNNGIPGEDCSSSLMLAMSSLGALMSPKGHIRNLANQFFESAVTLMKDQGLLSPRLTSIQALLCCSFFELGRGNASKGWMYSGMAHSMAQILGLQRDVEDMGYKNGRTPQEIKSWRRTFVNCFQSDKIICLQLGRSVLLHQKDTDNKCEEHEKVSTMWESWLEEHGLSNPTTGASSTAISKQQTDLMIIIQDMLSQQSSSAQRALSSQRWTEVSINELNTRFWRWLNTLPASCRWNRWGSNVDPVYPNIAALHMLYHTAVISLNRPFLDCGQRATESQSPALAKIVSDAISTCEVSADTIISILNRFKAQYGLRVAPLSFVHGTIMAVEASLGVAKLDVNIASVTDDSSLSALDAALDGMSYTWEIAGHARRGLRVLLTERESGEDWTASMSSSSRATETTTSPAKVYEPKDLSIDYLHVEFPHVGFDADLLDMLPVGAFDAVDSFHWPLDVMMTQGDQCSQRIAFLNTETCLPAM